MDLTRIISGIVPSDREYLVKAQARTAQLLMPARAMGRLHEVAERICAMRRTAKPRTDAKAIVVMAGDHGVTDEGVSAYPADVTAAMVLTFIRGGATINVLARQLKASITVVDMGIRADLKPAPGFLVRKIAAGTGNFARGPAMTRAQAETAVLTGFAVGEDVIAAGGADLLGTGDMGIGNTTPATAVGAVITGRPVAAMTGRGTGVDDAGLARKIAVITQGIALNRPDPRDGLDVLAGVGGFEIGGIAGLCLAAAHHRVPVVIDGLISTAGALIAHALAPASVDYMIAGHCSFEQGHRPMLDHLGLAPLLDLGMRLGEGTGAALAMHIVQGAVNIHNEVLTFGDVGLAQKT
ncbi:MAG: nicotinate-nucleotide--dimethylbenzimidazole phosphoribosyltransferase [Planctomycetota bacterium]